MRTSCVAQELCSVLCDEGDPKWRDVYKYVARITLLYSREYTALLKQLYSSWKKQERQYLLLGLQGQEDRSNAHSSPEWSGDASRPSLGEMAVAIVLTLSNAVGSEPATCLSLSVTTSSIWNGKRRKWCFKCPLDEIQKEQNGRPWSHINPGLIWAQS